MTTKQILAKDIVDSLKDLEKLSLIESIKKIEAILKESEALAKLVLKED